MGAYGILAKMRVQLFDSIDRVAPAWLIGRETGDLMNIAVSDIETLEFFFAHTIGPMFTVILLPLTTVILAFCVNPLYAWVLIPIYLMISVVLPFSALKAGRGIGMRYRERLGILKSKILESVYSIRDIQIFGAGERKAEEDVYKRQVEDYLAGMAEGVKVGKIRQIGIANCFAWQLAEANAIAKENGWPEFVSVQNHYTLIMREEEREMNVYAAERLSLIHI